MANPIPLPNDRTPVAFRGGSSNLTFFFILLGVGIAIYIGTIFSPPSLSDDVDAVNAHIARNMLDSGDWVTARINGVVYLEKSPLGYWLIAICYAIFGVYDWVARLPTALGAVALMWVTAVIGRWAYGPFAGFYSGIVIGTCVGLFQFTRILIPDVLLTLTITFALYCFLRTVVDQNKNRFWAYGFWASLGAGLLFKGLLAVLVPVATATLYLLIQKQFLSRRTWAWLRPISGIALMLGIFLPWVVLAAWRNPPIFDFTFRSEPGVYRGFMWFYFINEHVLRFLNMRYPRDYNTVPRLAFLLLHMVWLFPWSVFLPAALRSPRGTGDQKARSLWILAMVWILFLLTFLNFSTTQEYYSMPCYPAFAILIGAALATAPSRWISAGYGVLAVFGSILTIMASVILYLTRAVVPVGDISQALTRHPEAYTLFMGHLQDLSLRAFAYLRGPLVLAVTGIAGGTLLAWFLRRKWVAPICLAMMMVMYAHAARWAMKRFEPYLSSRPLADAIAVGPKGRLILEGHYYPFSSVGFYTNLPPLLLNGRADNLVYGSAAPLAPPVFIEEPELAELWKGSQRLYLVAPATSRPRLEQLLGNLKVFACSGGKFVFTNVP